MKKGLKIIFKNKRPFEKNKRFLIDEVKNMNLTDPKKPESNGINLLQLKEEAEIERNKWRGRRTMAGISLASMILVMASLLYGPISEARIKTLEEPITWFFFSMASVIGAYMGFTTWASKRKGKDE